MAISTDFLDQLRRHARERPNDVALGVVRGNERQVLTWQALLSEINLLGARLSQIQPSQSGAHVAILMEDSPKWGAAFVAAYSAGWVVVPLDPSRDSVTLCQIVRHADCRALIFSQQHATAAREIAKAISGLALLDGSSHGSDRPLGSNGPLPLAKRDPDDDLAIIYTGGTTGLPKGVRLTERNVLTNISDSLVACPLNANDHLLAILPLFHVMSLIGNLLDPLYVGAKVTFLHDYDPVRLLRTIHDEAITVFGCVPQFYYLLIRRIREQVTAQPVFRRIAFHRMLDLSRFLRQRLKIRVGRWLFASIHERFGPKFRLFVVGAASFAPEAGEFLLDLGFGLSQGYGMTEVCVVTMDPDGPNGGLTCGLPFARAKIRIHEPDRDGIGEVLIAGDSVMAGYWKEPQATLDVLRDGWLWTGDLGWIDASGRLRVTGRKKEVIVLGSGRNVYPEQVEYEIRKSGFIKEVCVLRIVSNDGTSERLHAVVVPDFERLRSNGVINIQDQIRFDIDTAGRAAHQQINSLEIRDEPLPRTSTGKLKRFEVLPGLASPTKPTQSEPAAGPEPALFTLIRRVKPDCGPITPASRLELDLGFDSLQRVELFSNIRVSLGIEVSDEEGAQIFTVGDLAQKVGTVGQAGDEQLVSWQEILRKPLSDGQRRIASLHLERRPAFELFMFVVCRLVRIAAKFLLKFQVTGTEKIPREYPFILCANHASYLDALLIAAAVPFPAFRRMFFIGGKKYFRNPLQRWFGRRLHALPIDAASHAAATLRLAAEGLKEGYVLCVFPEGHRSIDGTLLPFQKGPSILAIEAGVPIVPLGIVGTQKVWGRGSRRLRLSPVQLRFGAPIYWYSRETGQTNYEGLTTHLQAVIAELIRAPGAG